MNRTAKDRQRQPGTPKPVQKVNISEKHWRGRLVLTLLFAAIGIGALLYGLLGSLGTEGGWQEIEAEASSKENCGNEFVFLYELGAAGQSPSAEKKAVAALYTDGLEKGYRLFHEQLELEGVHNIFYINQHPNEKIEVDPELYQAFLTMQESGGRQLYLGPIYAEYNNLFSCREDWEAETFDASRNEEEAAYFAEVLSYANSEDDIELRLLEDNTVELFVSDAYLAYAKEIGFTNYIDFFWMKNAFIIDILADSLIEAGYTRGAISSYDGFVRNLDESGNEYSFALYDRAEQSADPASPASERAAHVVEAAVMRYTGPRSLVYLRNYEMNESLDVQHYYTYEDGETRTAYIDTADGLCKSALPGLIAYSSEKGCAETLLAILPVYIADTFDAEPLEALTREGIDYIYFEGRTIRHSEEGLTLTDLYDRDGVTYQDGNQR